LAARVQAGKVALGNDLPLVAIAGTCVIEDRDSALRHAEALAALGSRLGMPVVYKSSFDKANRSSKASFRGPGLERGLEILGEVRERFGLPVLTDVHEPAQAKKVAAVVDIVQVPALLCRQTDLLEAAGSCGKPVNIKKGQFLSPWEMRNVVGKVVAAGASAVLLTERGTCFGYNNLVADMRSLAIMRELGWPVVFDATHSVQLPGALGESSGGERQFAPVLARAAVAVGVAAVFFEVHEAPERAMSDAATSLPLGWLEHLLAELRDLDRFVKERRP